MSMETSGLDPQLETIGDTNLEQITDQLMIEKLDTIDVGHSYLERVSDFVSAEAISESVSALFEGGLFQALEAYGSEVRESYQERELEKRIEAYNKEPAFTRSDWDALQAQREASSVEAVAAKTELATTEAELKEAKTELAEVTTKFAEMEERLSELESATQSPIAVDSKPIPVSYEPTMTDYEVTSGDTLSKIAEKVYGDASKWHQIYEANRDLIGLDPNKLQVGQNLNIPPLAEDDTFRNYIPSGGGSVPASGGNYTPTQPVNPGGNDIGDDGQGNHDMVTDVVSDISEEQLQALEAKIDSLIKDPNGITERNITSNADLDNQRIVLKNEMTELDRHYLRNEVTVDTYDAFNQRYTELSNQYNQVSAALYRQHVADIPLQYADATALDRLQYNSLLLDRALAEGNPTEIEYLLDKSWRDYDYYKSPQSAHHNMPGGRIPNSAEADMAGLT